MKTESLIYFSSRSGNCHRFIEKLGVPATRLPIGSHENSLIATKPYVLLLPTYGGGGSKGAVPKEVIQFLNIEVNRTLIRGVIAAGNTNFGDAYAIAGNIIAQKCHVPYLYRFELLGTDKDVQSVQQGLKTFWLRTNN
ncbi:class Ib ribonucleoside-diphosphate reductase assembly flavoprotein NrdI [Providencia rettgeri]|uniref:Protein NrdI n=1 Tax=Providencia rettgeri TaxID=587 RepID=A0AAE2ZED6_PRORE|nr:MULTISPECIES: class Ib ribonucleoside-diphosphate reductase assembly flavoprotein NrdI [Providencia]MBW3116418.1 class Ib ribonucleoside-diphosphate reductase assembly flavoprotein NrdI [Providencia rettgeri]MCK9791913.1 class Ib ribonucleoside-diphosphate reductase assembly flavoprotein NrdI [Providencia rettgeri]MDX7425708.1 class Ib ribonucleoside-diphosphate reductase assembly flavoprotein NrdI [Providencia sp. CIM-Carb-044]NHN52711.1 class Ib ribonucleoside-diphosphate reductase assembl